MWSKVAVVVGALVVGAVAAAGALFGDAERVAAYWVAAAVDVDGSASVTEVIDYDFGTETRHGIYRDVPGLSAEAEVTASSPTAPDDLELLPAFSGTRIRIGDPYRTITGRHRYTITYPLSGVVEGRTVAWDAVGTDWTVGISGTEIHLTAPWELTDLECDQGSLGEVGGCTVEQTEPGHLVARIGGLSAGEGVTLYARLGRSLERAPAAPAPPGPPEDSGTGWLPPALTAVVAALGVAVPVTWASRRAGRERVAPGGAVAAAFPDGLAGGEVLVDEDDLADLATVEFAPPEDLAAWQGGILLEEHLSHEHQVAWLLEAVARGWVRLDQDGSTPVLTPGPEWPDPASAPLVAGLFDGRSRVELHAYDSQFAKGWHAVGATLQQWRDTSGLWDPAGDRRRTRVLVLGLVGVLVGLLLAGVGGAVAARLGPMWLTLVAAGGIVAGAAVAGLASRGELRVRNPRGSALWLRTESFRRFLAESEARHVEEAARRHQLLEYTAWAVALGAADRWAQAVRASSVASLDPGVSSAVMASSLVSATRTASVAPSSSSGGSGGGGVGGGGGGGGGGSW